MKTGTAIIRPELRLEWEHEYGDTATGLDAQLASGASNAAVFIDRLTAYAYYDGQFFRANYDDSIVTGGFRVSF